MQYSIAYGTMLGAVRHHGFIPWDDDIDVYMKRNDYEKLLSLVYDDGKYEIKSYRYSKGYYYPFSKMIDKGTCLIENNSRLDSKLGVYIDIFPLDTFNIQNENDKKFLLDKAHNLCYNAFNMGHKLSCHKRLSFRYFAKVIYLIVTYPYKKRIINKLDSFCRQSNNGNYYAMLLYPSGIEPFFCQECISSTEQIDFENFNVPIYTGYDIILSQVYGDYMKLPPKEERISNHSFIAYRKR